MTTKADIIYSNLLHKILIEGEEVETRNHKTFSSIDLPTATFDSFPLITVRKTACKKAIREMEWFLGNSEFCPEELLDWWSGQLDMSNALRYGYPSQFRFSTYFHGETGKVAFFDQIAFLIKEIKEHPASRRLILTSWNPGEMANITTTNDNPNTPTTCHNTCTQFFVRHNKLHLKTYQRSADMLLGVPHNWVQTWALLVYMAERTGFEVGTMQWTFGDGHIYNEVSHLEVANSFIDFAFTYTGLTKELKLEYKPTSLEFLSGDFHTIGTIPEPTILTRPSLR